MKIKGVHHLGIAVRNLDESLAGWARLFGSRSSAIEEAPERGVRLAQIQFPEGPAVELLEPLGENSPLAKFLDSRGEGLHHFTLEVEEIEAVMEELRQAGLQFVSEIPQAGAGGTRIAFIHPRSLNGVLLELRESPPPK
jgi:methylmalonyl-CoA/ethylmalonyl-CoA epimerase